MIATRRGPSRPSTLCGVILAGGHRWGGNELESIVPRAMLPIVGSPLVAYAVRSLREAGIREVIVCANSATRAVAGMLGDGRAFDLDIRYFEDITPRGPAGCIREAAAMSAAETFVAMEASSIILGRVREVIDQHLSSNAALTLGMTHDRLAGSAVSATRPAGIFACGRSALEHVKSIGYSDLKEALIPTLRERGKQVASVSMCAETLRVRDFDAYLAANEFILSQLLEEQWAFAGHERCGASLIHRSARVSDRAKLIGPVWIGPDAEVSAGATLVGPVCVGKGTMVGSGATLTGSVLWDNSIAGEASWIDSSVLSFGAQVGAGESTYHALQTHVGVQLQSRTLSTAKQPATYRPTSPAIGVESRSAV